MTASAEAKRLAQIAAQAALDLNGHDIVALDVSGTNSFADIFVVVTGSSDRNVVAIADAVQDAMVENGVKMRGREGRELGEWVLQNFGDVVVHTFQEESRDFYALERIWNTAPVVELDLHDGAESTSAH